MSLRSLVVACTIALLFPWIAGAEDAASGVKVKPEKAESIPAQVLAIGDTEVRVDPAAGCNAYSIKYKGRELLKQPKTAADVPGYTVGVPVLYPTPNRVADAKFVYDGKTYKFEPNDKGRFLHGLVHSLAWKADGEAKKTADSMSQTFSVDFTPGTKQYELFPFEHTLRLEIAVRTNSVRFTYTADNKHGKKAVPFGFAIHPWFLYQGERANTYLQVPAESLMEAKNLMPTGKLVSLDGSSYDLRKPKSLEGFVIDDVYYGMTPEKPAKIEFRDKKLAITLKSSPDFTHMVVYTPKGEPWFCVENQTCSTDAHNFNNKPELKKVAHLLVVEPGKKLSGHAELVFSEK